MTRYFFDVSDGDNIALDEEGMELPRVQAAQEEAARSLADMVRDKFRRRFPKWLFRCEIVTGPLLMPSLYGSRALERIEAQSIAARQRRLRAHVPIRATRAGYLSLGTRLVPGRWTNVSVHSKQGFPNVSSCKKTHVHGARR